ncbi:MAG: hypothetical protein HYY76_14135 [Acidobacteria bacterium]|nr:hypothetical protein [Acidobacteriota bacterium]
MIRTVAKLVVALALLHAAARGAMVAWKYYQLKDAAYQAVLFGGNTPTGRLVDVIFEKAIELEVPLERRDVDVRREGSRTMAEVYYTEPVALLPGVTYPVDLSFSVEAPRLDGLTQ